ncbi:GNAT family N-acetyltransferase [Geodermatophilus marinus]|uniref:GNAT family N-acetyltransferase n=1 Tax=Geodermatophilus sp. LHW52908 TaxID=2303986 RepID=UPI000E3B6D00|nr:GNAT family N-acetyltransferase [Geodermatophilus sp. LHW52908]RFU21492.1 N-acetyltransferase family protein [Geodermatophilus sp. LHW52908]
MADGQRVRDATAADAAACAGIYAPYVRDTAFSFEAEPPSTAEMAGRIDAALAAHAWVVLEDGGEVAGYAYGTAFMTREAYRWSTTVSVYTDPGRRRPGAGRALYAALLDRLAGRGYRRALAGIVLPNPASEGLHRALGFVPVGTYRRVGWKLGRWHDVAWYQRPLGPEGDDDGAPEPPR